MITGLWPPASPPRKGNGTAPPPPPPVEMGPPRPPLWIWVPPAPHGSRRCARALPRWRASRGITRSWPRPWGTIPYTGGGGGARPGGPYHIPGGGGPGPEARDHIYIYICI